MNTIDFGFFPSESLLGTPPVGPLAQMSLSNSRLVMTSGFLRYFKAFFFCASKVSNPVATTMLET